MMLFSFLLIGMMLIVAETSLFHYLPAWLGHPDFVFILVAFAAYRMGWGAGLVLVFLLGWMLDVVSGIQLGLYPLQNIIVFSTLKILSENSPLKESTYQVPLVGLSYFVVQVGLYSIFSVFMPEELPDWSWSRVVQETFILLLATIPFFVLLNHCLDFFNRRRTVRRVLSKRSGNQFRS